MLLNHALAAGRLKILTALFGTILLPFPGAALGEDGLQRLRGLYGNDAYVLPTRPAGSIKVQLNSNADKGLAALAKEPEVVRKLVRELIILDPTISRKGIQTLSVLPNVEFLYLTRNEGWRPEFAEIVAASRSLKSLWVQEVGLTKADVGAISKASNLTSLMIGRNPIQAGGFQSLSSLNKLSQLDLSETGIEDGDLKFLSELSELKTLHLDHTKVSDDGIAAISVCKNLEILSLVGTRVTADGAVRLRKELPELILSWRSGVTDVVEEGRKMRATQP